jgi:hypothetical protein
MKNNISSKKNPKLKQTKQNKTLIKQGLSYTISVWGRWGGRDKGVKVMEKTTDNNL